jgi:drug/metabolite transporter (DMT)-like permease
VQRVSADAQPSSRDQASTLETSGYIGGLVAVSAWGANVVILKFLTGAMPIELLNASRLLIASLSFLLIVGVLRVRKGFPRVPNQVWAMVFVSGAIGTSFYQYFFASGIKLSNASIASLLSSTNPVWIGVIGAAMSALTNGRQGERLNRWQLIGIPVTMLGVALLSWQGIVSANIAPLGVAFLIVSNLFWAIYTIASRPLFAHFTPLEFTAFSLFLGALPYLLFSLPTWSDPSLAQVPGSAWFWVVASALLAQVIGFTAWFSATQKLGAARVSILLNITPIVALALAALVLNERLTVLKVVAAVVIFLGVYLANRRVTSG